MGTSHGPEVIPVRFGAQVFRLSAIKKAAYKYIDQFSCEITLQEAEVLCAIQFKSGIDESTRLWLVEEFRKEVLDQDLREQVRDETAAVRNLILAHTFSKSGIVTNEQVPED